MKDRPMSSRLPGRLPGLTRRAALLAPLGLLAGCDTITGWFEDSKVPLPGRREPILVGQNALRPSANFATPVIIPPPVANPDWAQPGGNPAHVMGNLAANGLERAWRADIGESGGYRQKIPCTPVVAGGRVFTMDPDGVVRAFDLRSGEHVWTRGTRAPKDRSTNVGGGVSFDGSTLFVATGRAEVLALDPATGLIRWRKPLGEPARCAPTIGEGKLFVTTMADRLVALSTADGSQLWTYQAQSAATSVLGQPSPAYADGLVVAGFGSGDLVAVHADSGSLVWADSLASVAGSNLANISAVRGLPVIDRDRVFAIGLGGLMLALDLRSGRRLWERETAGGDTPWVAGDWIYIVNVNQQLAALSRDDGQVRWMVELPRWTNQKRQTGQILWRGPVMVDGHLLVVSTDHTIQSRLAGNGAEAGQRVLPDAATISPVVASNTLLVLTDDGALTAYR
jgi:outer membrane protein assembly factor BamB